MAVDELVKQKRTEVETLKNNVTTLRASIEAKQKKGEAVGDEQTTLRTMVDTGMEAKAELERLLNELDLTSTELKADADLAQRMSRNGGQAQLRKSWGQAVIESQEFKNKQISQEHPVNVGNFNEPMGWMQRKAIYSMTDGAGGYLIAPDRQTDILDIARKQPRSVLDLVTHTTTNSDLVEYFVMATRTESAAEVSERTATGGTPGDDVFGLKPESNRTFGYFTAAVRTVAAWIGVSRQILEDQKQMRNLIDDELAYEVEKKLEAMLIAAVIAWSGIQSRVHAVSGARFDASDSNADTLRRAITDLALEFYYPTGIVVHPAQGEELELHKDDIQNYMNVYDSVAHRIWRVPVLETPAITAGTALVADWKLAVKVWDREQTKIFVGQPDDYFLRNAFAILAELRAAYAVVRPKAVEKVTGLV